MNKAELIDALTAKLNVDRRQATEAVENVVDTIVRAVHKGDSVTITGFGVFEQRRRAARCAQSAHRRDREGEAHLCARVPSRRSVQGRCRRRPEAPGRGSRRQARCGRWRGQKAAAKKAVRKAVAKKVVRKAAVKKVVAKKAPARKAPPRRLRPKAPPRRPRQEGSGQEGREEGSGQEGREEGQEGPAKKAGPQGRRQEGSGPQGPRQEGSGQEGSGQEGPPLISPTNTPRAQHARGVFACRAGTVTPCSSRARWRCSRRRPVGRRRVTESRYCPCGCSTSPASCRRGRTTTPAGTESPCPACRSPGFRPGRDPITRSCAARGSSAYASSVSVGSTVIVTPSSCASGSTVWVQRSRSAA